VCFFFMNSYILQIYILHEFIYMALALKLIYMNSYIKSNLATKEAAVSISDDLEGNMKAVLGEEISDVVEASASADAFTAMAVTPVTLAAAVSSVVAVAKKKGGEWIDCRYLIDEFIFSMNS
jgi:hypothetical protein